MNRIEHRMAGIVAAAAIGVALLGTTDEPDTVPRGENGTAQVRAKSPFTTETPRLERIVVRPTPEQMAILHVERRMIGVEYRTGARANIEEGSREATEAL